MWFFKSKAKLQDAKGPTSKTINVVKLADDNSFSLFVVGESNYQGALRSLSGGHSKDGVEVKKLALLVPEPTNQFDKNAVYVSIEDKKVGYLSRDDAIEFHRSMQSIGRHGEIAAVDAVIVGGFTKADGSKAHFGVRLDLSFPFEP